MQIINPSITINEKKMYLNGINFREVENFAFREDLFSRMSCSTIFREDLPS